MKTLICVLFIFLLSIVMTKAATSCGTTHCCFHWPPTCTPYKDCPVIVTYRYIAASNMLQVEMNSTIKGWFAFGLNSAKEKMDGTIGEICYLYKGAVKVRGFENKGTEFGFTTSLNPSDVTLLANTNNVITCRYTRPVKRKLMRDLSQSWYLVSAWGKMGGGEEPEEHPTGGYFWTKQKVNLQKMSCGKMTSTKWNLVALHGSFTIIGWIGMAASGIFFARYTKPLLSSNFLSQKLWFQGHRFTLATGNVFAIVGTIVIIAQADSFRTEMGAHPILGIVTLVLGLLQAFFHFEKYYLMLRDFVPLDVKESPHLFMIAALLRPPPTHPKRWIFNWGHRFGGVSALIIAMVTIITGSIYVEINAAVVPVYIVLILLIVILLEVKLRFLTKHVADGENEDGKRATQNFAAIRVAMVLVFVVGFIFTVTLIGLLIHQSNQLKKVRV